LNSFDFIVDDDDDDDVFVNKIYSTVLVVGIAVFFHK